MIKKISKGFCWYLHDSHNRPAIVRKIVHASYHIRRIEKRLRMCSQKHEEAHRRHRRPIDHSRDSGPYEYISEEALNRSGGVNHPWPGKGPAGGWGSDGGVKKTRNDAGVGADVFENGNDVEGGLIVGLGGLESGRIDAEGVGSTADTLNPNSKGGCNPFVGHKPKNFHLRRWVIFLVMVVRRSRMRIISVL